MPLLLLLFILMCFSSLLEVLNASVTWCFFNSLLSTLGIFSPNSMETYFGLSWHVLSAGSTDDLFRCCFLIRLFFNGRIITIRRCHVFYYVSFIFKVLR